MDYISQILLRKEEVYYYGSDTYFNVFWIIELRIWLLLRVAGVVTSKAIPKGKVVEQSVCIVVSHRDYTEYVRSAESNMSCNPFQNWQAMWEATDLLYRSVKLPQAVLILLVHFGLRVWARVSEELLDDDIAETINVGNAYKSFI